METCIFCKIANKEINPEIVYEDENFIAFKNIKPKAPIHVLVIPKSHLGPINTLGDDSGELIGELILKAKKIAVDLGISDDGYRLIFNIGQNAGMEVKHLHLHLLAGKPLKFEF